MKSKKSCYDAAVGHITIRRYGLIGLLYTIGMTLLVVGSVNGSSYTGNAAMSIQRLCNVIPVCNLIYAAMLAQLLMGDLYTTRLSYALRSLPITLGGWFGTQVTLGIVSVLPGILIPGAVLALMLTAYKTTVLIFMAYAILTFLFFYGVALLSSVCAGNRIGMLLIYCIINFIGLFYGWAVMQIFSPLIYGLFLPNYSAKFVPLMAILSRDPFRLQYYQNLLDVERNAANYFASREIESIEYTNSLWVLLGFAIAGCVLIGLSMVLLRRRKPECAGDLLAFKQLNPVMLVICALCTGILFHIIADFFGWEVKLPTLFVGIILGYYAALMLLKRQTNVFTRKAFVPLALLLLLAFGGVTATGLDLWGITYRVPDASQVEEVEIGFTSDGRSLRSSDPEAIALAIQIQQESLDDHRQLERARPLLKRIYGSEEGAPEELVAQDTFSTAWITLRYTLKNGHQMNRLYTVRSTYDCIAAMNAIFSTPEYIFDRSLLDDNQKFDREYFMERLKYVELRCYHDRGELYVNTRTSVIPMENVPGLLDAILQDCEAGNMAQNYVFHRKDDDFWDDITFYFPNPTGNFTDFSTIRLYSSCKNTIQYLIDHGFYDPLEAK